MGLPRIMGAEFRTVCPTDRDRPDKGSDACDVTCGVKNMPQQPKWQYDELNPVGVDYDDPAVADGYETHRARFRDYAKHGQAVIDAIGPDDRRGIIDLGCGTGAFAIFAAGHYEKVFAVDVSQAMLDHSRGKAEAAAAANIEFHRGGFLTYEHEGDPVDAVVSMGALHHLPDFWKLVGLKRVAAMLTGGGTLYLSDNVYSFDPGDYEKALDGIMAKVRQTGAPDFARQLEVGFREEFITTGWIMEGLLTCAGFAVQSAEYPGVISARYVCSKVTD